MSDEYDYDVSAAYELPEVKKRRRTDVDRLMGRERGDEDYSTLRSRSSGPSGRLPGPDARADRRFAPANVDPRGVPMSISGSDDGDRRRGEWEASAAPMMIDRNAALARMMLDKDLDEQSKLQLYADVLGLRGVPDSVKRLQVPSFGVNYTRRFAGGGNTQMPPNNPFGSPGGMPQRPGMPPQRPGMPPQRPGMLPAPQGGMPFQSPSTPPPTRANGIAGAFQGVNPAKAGYDVGTAAIMANQQQQQPKISAQQRLQEINASPTGQAMTMRNMYLNNPDLVNPNIPQKDYAAMGFSPEAAAARQAFDKQQQQMGVDFRTQLMNTNSPTQAAALMQQYATNLGNADQQFLQQNPAFAQQAQANADRAMGRPGQNLGGGQGGGMPGQLGGQPQANLQAMDAAMLTQALSAQGGMGLQPQQMQGLGDTAQRQIALANLSPAQQMQQLQQQGGMGGMPGQLGGQPLRQLGGLQGQFQAGMGNQFGMQQGAAGMGNQYQQSLPANLQTQANLGGAAGSLQQSLNAARAMPPVPGMSAPPGQQVNMFGAGAPMPQQQAPAGANFGVGPFGPGMGVQGGTQPQGGGFLSGINAQDPFATRQMGAQGPGLFGGQQAQAAGQQQMAGMGNTLGGMLGGFAGIR